MSDVEDIESLEKKAFEIFMKRLPTVPYTDANAKGYRSAIEQSFEIAQEFTKTFRDLLTKVEDKK